MKKEMKKEMKKSRDAEPTPVKGRSPEETIKNKLFPYNCVKRKGHTQTFGTM